MNRPANPDLVFKKAARRAKNSTSCSRNDGRLAGDSNQALREAEKIIVYIPVNRSRTSGLGAVTGALGVDSCTK
jgi:hypothetical protein